MSTRRRRRYRRFQGIDLFRGLGPGDPGYRLRPGASGLDPMEAYMEQGRVIGLLLKSLIENPAQVLLLPSLVILFAGLTLVSYRLLSPVNFYIRTDVPIALVVPVLVLAAVLLAVVAKGLTAKLRGER